MAYAGGSTIALLVRRDVTERIINKGVIYCKGEMYMVIDLHAKSIELLEIVANSVHERDPKHANLLCFSSNEVLVVEEWIREFIKELQD